MVEKVDERGREGWSDVEEEEREKRKEGREGGRSRGMIHDKKKRN